MKQNVKIAQGIPNVGILDFSWLLDAPAGKHGFVKVKDGHLYYNDGNRAKFIGFNLPTRASLPDHESADKLSYRLATLGVNVIRLHAADAPIGGRNRSWSTNPEHPLIDYMSGSSEKLNSKGLDLFDYFVFKLKERGIYIHVDLLVARSFMDGDNLDYPNSPKGHIKGITHLNQRLIDLQKKYATKLLTHINPYTKLPLIDEPAVMTIQIVNEDSIFYDAHRSRDRNTEGIKPYRQEMQKRFNYYLLSKYNSRKNLAKSWTYKDECALYSDEDPERGTVKCIDLGDYEQPTNDPMGEWSSFESPSRYADFTEFCIMLNRKYYGEMIDHVRSLGSKVPIATTNLFSGAADVFSSSDDDISQNNSYFNHPDSSEDNSYYLSDLREYITTDPRQETYDGITAPRNNITVAAVTSHVKNKPFILSEWNEYGLHPFHSSAQMMTAAYACLNDWDGLITYCYHTSDNINDQADDYISDIMDSFNDPSLICQFGTMAALFLQGLVKPANNEIEIVYTMNDLLTQVNNHRLPESILPFISKYRTCFLNQGDNYSGDADVAISAGFVSTGNYDNAKRAILYAHSPYRDTNRHYYAGKEHLQRYVKEGSKDILDIAKLNEKYLVFNDIKSVVRSKSYKDFANSISIAMKEWKILKSNQGIVDEDNIVSDTGELVFNPVDGFFEINAENISYFTGKPKDKINLGKNISVKVNNQRITIALLSLDNNEVNKSTHMSLVAMGKSGLDETTIERDERRGYKVHMKGKLYLDSLEGSIMIKNSNEANLIELDSYGKTISSTKKQCNNQGIIEFTFDGSNKTANYELKLIK